ncbi:hypothetical protein [Haloimpatiens massiliensis]|uniref:hypothetical protein n=1 Tax=Haloimpatiens massiliensis TaxID=1658110 RepID=UPI0015E108EA|nr:hypothetical protein [Haloimpatiens massiliensis]
MPNKITNHIISIDDRIYNYLNDVNYGINKPQFHHLTTIIKCRISLNLVVGLKFLKINL